MGGIGAGRGDQGQPVPSQHASRILDEAWRGGRRRGDVAPTLGESESAHSGHSGSLIWQLSLRSLSPGPLLTPYPVPTPRGTSPNSRELTGKDEGSE